MTSCVHPDLKDTNTTQIKSAPLTKVVKKPIVIDIIPFNDISFGIANYVLTSDALQF